MPLPLPARVKPGDDVTAHWANQIRDAIYRLSKRGGSLPLFYPSNVQLPLTVSEETISSARNLSALGGAYQEGSAGAWVVIPPTAAAPGDFAYLVISQNAARAITAVDVSIEAAALDPVTVSGATTYSNVPLAEIETVDSVDKLIQRRHGNFTIGLHQIDGDVVRWPDTLVGTIPTPEPPP